MGKRIPLVVSIAFHTRRKKELSINELAVRPPMRQNQTGRVYGRAFKR